jgi:hypothetical protein
VSYRVFRHVPKRFLRDAIQPNCDLVRNVVRNVVRRKRCNHVFAFPELLDKRSKGASKAEVLERGGVEPV